MNTQKTPQSLPDLEQILEEIRQERAYQDGKWALEFDDKNTANDWVAYIACYLGKSFTLPWNRVAFRAALIKVAALCVAAIQALTRNDGLPPRHYDK